MPGPDRRVTVAAPLLTTSCRVVAGVLLACLGAATAGADPPVAFAYEPQLRPRSASAPAAALPIEPLRGTSPDELAALARTGITAIAGSGPLLAATLEVARIDGAALVTADLATDVAWLEIGRLWSRIENEVLARELDVLARGLRDGLGDRAAEPALEPARAIAAAYAELLLALGPSKTAPREPRAIAALAAFARGESVADLLVAPLAPPADALDLAGAMLGRPDLDPSRVDPRDPRWLAALLVTRAIYASPEQARRWERLTALVTSAVGGHPGGDPRPIALRLREAGPDRAITGPDGASRAVLAALDRSRLAPAIALLGPRQVVDHDWLARASYPHAGTPAVPRTDPGGLDLAAALGSPLALAELVAMDARWPGLREAILTLAIERLPMPAGIDGACAASLDVDCAYAAGLDVAAAMLRTAPPSDAYAREAWHARCAAFAVGTWLRMRTTTAAPCALAVPPPTAAFRVEPVPGVYARAAALVRAVDRSWSAALEPGDLRDDVTRALAPLAHELDDLAELAANASGVDPTSAHVAEIVARWSARPIHPSGTPEPWVVLARAADPTGRARAVRARLTGALVASFVVVTGAQRTVVRGATYGHAERASESGAPEPAIEVPGEALPAWIAHHLVRAGGAAR